jgi:hypothetical protein
VGCEESHATVPIQVTTHSGTLKQVAGCAKRLLQLFAHTFDRLVTTLRYNVPREAAEALQEDTQGPLGFRFRQEIPRSTGKQGQTTHHRRCCPHAVPFIPGELNHHRPFVMHDRQAHAPTTKCELDDGGERHRRATTNFSRFALFVPDLSRHTQALLNQLPTDTQPRGLSSYPRDLPKKSRVHHASFTLFPLQHAKRPS